MTATSIHVCLIIGINRSLFSILYFTPKHSPTHLFLGEIQEAQKRAEEWSDPP